MGGTYFVGRKELLNWVNQLLGTTHKRVEELCSGSTYCRIFNVVFPKVLPLKKVNFNARLPYEYHKNYKVLQVAFDRKKIGKKIEIERLTAGKYQDNLEFLQWFKTFFDQNHLHTSSNQPIQPPPQINQKRRTGKKRKNASNLQPQVPNKRQKISNDDSSSIVNLSPVEFEPPSNNPSKKPDSFIKTTIHDDNKITIPPPPPPSHDQEDQPQEEFQPLVLTEEKPENNIEIPQVTNQPSENLDVEANRKVAEMKISVDSLERERDFYFGKLREIELLCQTNENDPIVKKITKILYQTDDMDEFSSESESEEESESNVMKDE